VSSPARERAGVDQKLGVMEEGPTTPLHPRTPPPQQTCPLSQKDQQEAEDRVSALRPSSTHKCSITTAQQCKDSSHQVQGG
jgi:hypothetical protein